MAAGSLHPDNITPGPDRRMPPGHGIDMLGPSDTSDSGSDVKGAPGGDAQLDGDSDSGGTGERAAAVRDTVVPDGADIAPDHIENIPLTGQAEDED
jgi:hypothetical protein